MTERGNHDHDAPMLGSSQLSPRQGEILEFAAQGLPDEAIARRLHVSARILRLEFENVFMKLGVRDRERAITIWSGSSPRPGLPDDRCPYHRPFANDFSDCPAYRPRRVATVDLNDQPTGMIWTCSNLTAKPRQPEEMGWYAACAIGRPADRERWAAEQRTRNGGPPPS
jgi:DNA-binding CsgD family transcriptional regulator